jgi:hypothetical protein
MEANLRHERSLAALAQTEPRASPSGPSIENEPMLYCPICSRRLTEIKCKLICEQCGYYMSCADYY